MTHLLSDHHGDSFRTEGCEVCAKVRSFNKPSTPGKRQVYVEHKGRRVCSFDYNRSTLEILRERFVLELEQVDREFNPVYRILV